VTSRVAAAIGATAIILVVGAVGYIVTTFLFAFSGGQYRMVNVVNVGALAVIGVGALAAALTWWLRSSATAIKWTAIATGIGWLTALLVEWLLSFALGA
jgi:hypothetical protein